MSGNNARTRYPSVGTKQLSGRAISLSPTVCNERRIRRNVGEKGALNPLFRCSARRGGLVENRCSNCPSGSICGVESQESESFASPTLLFFFPARGFGTRGRSLFRFRSDFQIRSRGGCKKVGGIRRIRYETRRNGQAGPES